MTLYSYRLTLAVLCLVTSVSTWQAWGSQLSRNQDTINVLASSASLVTSIVGVALGISLSSPRLHEVEAGRLKRLCVLAFVLLGIGLLCVAFATVAPACAQFGALALGLGAALGVGTYFVLLGMFLSNRQSH